MKFFVIRAFTLFIALGAQISLAHACHCLHGPDALMSQVIGKELKESGGALVEAKVLSNEGDKGRHTTTFEVLDVWAGTTGASGKKISVRHNLNGEACGLKFEAGERLLLFATKNDEGMLMTSQCAQRLGEYAIKRGKARVKELAK